jgi:hypothetical protein
VALERTAVPSALEIWFNLHDMERERRRSEVNEVTVPTLIRF